MSLLSSIGSDISGVLKNVGLGNLNLGSIGSDILSEGKSLLGDVVKDSFTLSNQSNQTFASSMNIGGLSLPNPIGSLANKLLGDADTELNKFGVNVDFKKVAQELFNLPTQSGGSVSVPSIASRATSGNVPSAVATPIAAAVSRQADVVSSAGLGGGGSGSSTASTGLGGGGVTAPTGVIGGTSSSGSALVAASNGLAGSESNLDSQLASVAAGNAGTITINGQQFNTSTTEGQEAAMTALQQEEEQLSQMMSTISNILQVQNQTTMNTIGNIKG